MPNRPSFYKGNTRYENKRSAQLETYFELDLLPLAGSAGVPPDALGEFLPKSIGIPAGAMNILGDTASSVTVQIRF